MKPIDKIDYKNHLKGTCLFGNHSKNLWQYKLLVRCPQQPSIGQSVLLKEKKETNKKLIYAIKVVARANWMPANFVESLVERVGVWGQRSASQPGGINRGSVFGS